MNLIMDINQQKLQVLLIPCAIMNLICMDICLSIVSSDILILKYQYLLIEYIYSLCLMQNWFVFVSSI